MFIYYNAVLILIAWIVLGAYLLINSKRIGYLKRTLPVLLPQYPSVAIIVPVRNEEKNLQHALEHLCKLDYPNLEIIVVNDRSTDGSSAIIEKVSENCPLIKIIQITELPVGWVGKSNALYSGYKHTNAEWLLFTDADVAFEESALKKAISYCINNGTDHLTVFPEVRSRSEVVNSLNATFQLLLHLKYRPWAAGDPQSSAYFGLGAFNLVKKCAYDSIGTHARFALHPNDDLKLGECIKVAGFRQEVLYGEGSIQYEWYSSLQGFINGLTKNAYSSVQYNTMQVLASTVGALLFFVLPVPFFAFSGDYLLQLIAAGILTSQLFLLLWRRGSVARWWYVFMIPFASSIIIYIMLRSALLALWNNGIYWSECFYQLSELKKQR